MEAMGLSEAMAPGLVMPGWRCGYSRVGWRLSVTGVRSVGGLGKVALRGCRCAAAEGVRFASVEKEGRVSPQQCTYGALNVLWVASELQRLLTMQVSLTEREFFWTSF
jgi:hypothetical protein